jgi:hypothetical protein
VVVVVVDGGPVVDVGDGDVVVVAASGVVVDGEVVGGVVSGTVVGGAVVAGGSFGGGVGSAGVVTTGTGSVTGTRSSAPALGPPRTTSASRSTLVSVADTKA